jgi:hypothetical protein
MFIILNRTGLKSPPIPKLSSLESVKAAVTSPVFPVFFWGVYNGVDCREAHRRLEKVAAIKPCDELRATSADEAARVVDYPAAVAQPVSEGMAKAAAVIVKHDACIAQARPYILYSSVSYPFKRVSDQFVSYHFFLLV